LDALQRRLYLALHRGTPGDAEFYARVCRGATAVLELGVGDGRILSRIEVPRKTGIDVDEGMIELAAARCPDARLEVADMAAFDLEESFDRIIIPSSALFALPGLEAQAACFARVARHLMPNGEVWFDAYGSDAFHAEADPEPLTDDLGRAELEVLDEIDLDGRMVRVYEANHWDKDAQRFTVVYWFELKSRVVEQRLVHHYLLTEQVVSLARDAGLEVETLGSSFTGDPFEPESEQMVVGLRRAR
jgi:SAM-dependent methyltransferase